MILVLTRIESGSAFTHGIITHNDVFICHTIEPPWKGNQRNVSCIPDGEYTCTWQYWRKPKRVDIVDVPGRSEIQIHTGNHPSDSKGCILPGITRHAKDYLLNSAVAISRLWEVTEGKGFTLRIVTKQYPIMEA